MLFVIFLIISFGLIYLIFCVPSSDYTFLGRIKIRLKLGFEQFFNLMPASLRNKLISVYNYLVYKPNPSVQIFYVLFFATLFLIYYYYGIKKYFPHKTIPYNFIRIDIMINNKKTSLLYSC